MIFVMEPEDEAAAGSSFAEYVASVEATLTPEERALLDRLRAEYAAALDSESKRSHDQ